MSYELNLQISNTMKFNLIRRISNEIEFATVINDPEDPNRFVIHFPETKASILLVEVNDREVYAECYFGAKWRVGVVAFIDDRSVSDYNDVIKFIEKIMDYSESAFVLTYQYEKIYAVRVEGELFFTINKRTPKWLHSSKKALNLESEGG